MYRVYYHSRCVSSSFSLLLSLYQSLSLVNRAESLLSFILIFFFILGFIDVLSNLLEGSVLRLLCSTLNYLFPFGLEELFIDTNKSKLAVSIFLLSFLPVVRVEHTHSLYYIFN